MWIHYRRCNARPLHLQRMIHSVAAQDRAAAVHYGIGNPLDVSAQRERLEAIDDWRADNAEATDTRGIVTTLGGACVLQLIR